MRTLAALLVGYYLGAKTGERDLRQLVASIEALFGTEEFGEVLVAARSQLGSTLREVATIVEGHGQGAEAGGDVVAKVRHLIGQE